MIHSSKLHCFIKWIKYSLRQAVSILEKMQQQKGERHITATGNLKSSLINFRERYVCI